jgi:hypothetical protein
MVSRGTIIKATQKTMLITVNSQQFPAETANAVTGLPCRTSFVSKLRHGYDRALAGRDAS